jgi:hypothetical protein
MLSERRGSILRASVSSPRKRAHINPDANNPTVPLSTVKNKTTDLKRVGLIEEVDKDGDAPIYAPVETPGGTREDRPTHRPTVHTEDGGTNA